MTETAVSTTVVDQKTDDLENDYHTRRSNNEVKLLQLIRGAAELFEEHQDDIDFTFVNIQVYEQGWDYKLGSSRKYHLIFTDTAQFRNIVMECGHKNLRHGICGLNAPASLYVLPFEVTASRVYTSGVWISPMNSKGEVIENVYPHVAASGNMCTGRGEEDTFGSVVYLDTVTPHEFFNKCLGSLSLFWSRSFKYSLDEPSFQLQNIVKAVTGVNIFNFEQLFTIAINDGFDWDLVPLRIPRDYTVFNGNLKQLVWPNDDIHTIIEGLLNNVTSPIDFKSGS